MAAQLKDITIAVLPFVNMSSNDENEFFSDGITEEIINALAKISQLPLHSFTRARINRSGKSEMSLT
jgi:TolB-like protein